MNYWYIAGGARVVAALVLVDVGLADPTPCEYGHGSNATNDYDDASDNHDKESPDSGSLTRTFEDIPYGPKTSTPHNQYYVWVRPSEIQNLNSEIASLKTGRTSMLTKS